MGKEFFKKTTDLLQAKQKKKQWQKIVISLSLVVAMITSGLLIHPAITMERKAICGQEEHTHSAECYEKKLICDKEEHTASEVEEAAAKGETIEEHKHSDSCYKEELTCDKKEHKHSEDCYPKETEAKEETSQAKSTEETKTTEAPKAEETTEASKEEKKADEAKEETTEEKQEEKAEARTLTAKGEDYTVQVDCPAEAKIPENAELKVREIVKDKESDKEEYEAYYKKAQDALKEKEGQETDISTVRFFDISFMVDGKEIEPAAKVEVKITYDKKVEVSDQGEVKSVHFGEEKTEVLDVKTNEENGKMDEVTFDATSFSVYGVVGTESITVDYLTADGKTYEITVNLNDVTNIPKDANLEIRELKGAEYDQYLSDAAVELGFGIDDITNAKLFDITIKNGDEEIQPNGKVGVEVKLKDDKFDDAAVVHFGEETEVLEAITEDHVVSFETSSFSVYAIVEGGETQTYRHTYHFLTEIDEEGNASDFEFVNHAGKKVTTQIIKNGESLQEVDPPVTGVEKPFAAWYYATKNDDGTYTLTDEQVIFDEAITVGSEDKDYYIAPYFGDSIIVTFYDKVKGSDPIHIVTKRVVPLVNGTANIRVDNISVPTTATTVLSGWTMNGTDYPLSSYTTLTATENVNLYPIFTEGHWLRFVGGEAGSGAEYVPAIFVTANTQASELASLTPSTREGYTFDGWYYGAQDSQTGTITYGSQVSNGAGTVSDPDSLLAAVQTNETVLYGKWTGNTVDYRVAIWYENPDDDEYSFQSVTNKRGTAGAQTNESASSVSGFTAQTIEQQTIKGDGSTVVNIYYKRNNYTIKFYNYWGYREFTDLAITAKYGADIHEQWPGNKPGTEDYGAAWYISTQHTTFVTMVPTMPLNGDNYYQMTKGDRTLRTKFQVQSVNGGNTFTLYLQAPYSGERDYHTTADDYIHIDGFRVNAYSQNDANSIRNNATGDDDAVYDSNYSRSPKIGTYWSSGTNNTLNFYYLRNQYNVIFEENGGPSVNDLTDIYYEANIANTKANEIAAVNAAYIKGETHKYVTGEGDYVFQGWYDNSAFLGNEFDFNQKMPAGNVRLYAKWERVYYLVQIDPNGGEITADGEVTYTWLQYGDVLHQYNIQRNYVEDSNGEYTYFNVKYPGNDNDTIPSVQRKASYVTDSSSLTPGQSIWYNSDQKYKEATSDDYYSLIGWYNTETNQIYDFSSIITGDVSIQARWRRSGTFDIWYNPVEKVGDTTITGIITNEQDAGYADQSTTAILNTPTEITSNDNVTYVFKGWQVVDNFTDCNVLDSTFYVQGDDFLVDAAKSSDHKIFLQAVYEPAENDPDLVPVTNLIFDPNGGTGKRVEYNEQQINEAFDLSDAPAYTRTGYKLVGWSQSSVPTESDTVFSTTAVIGTDNLEPTEDGKNILYAIWEEKTFTVTVIKHVASDLGDDQKIPFKFTPSFMGLDDDLYNEEFSLAGSVVMTPDGQSELYNTKKVIGEVPYGTSFRITEESNGDFSTNVVYSITDPDNSSFDVTNQSTTNGAILTVNGNVTLEYTNTRKTTSINLEKVAKGKTAPLPGAEFTLVRKNSSGTYVVDEGVSATTKTLQLTDGTINIEGLPSGDYMITEKKSPDGYIILNSSIYFTVSINDVGGAIITPTDGQKDFNSDNIRASIKTGTTDTLIVPNTPGQALPNTGGSGTLPYTLGGIALIVASALMYGFRMRRRGRRLN